MPDLSNLVLFHSGHIRNFYLLVLGQVKINLQCCIYPHTFFLKSEGDIVIASVRPSARYAIATFFCALPPGALGRGQNVNHLISTIRSISFFYKYQTLYVFSQMKTTKHIRRDFHSVALVMPQGWGCPGGQILFFQHGHVAYQIDGDDEQNRMHVQFSS